MSLVTPLCLDSAVSKTLLSFMHCKSFWAVGGHKKRISICSVAHYKTVDAENDLFRVSSIHTTTNAC